jgi:hypothetical protein
MSEKFRPQPQPENPKQLDPKGGVAGPIGVSPPEQSPQGGTPKGPEHKSRTYIIYNPKNETLEEFQKRYNQAHAERREKLRKYQREYMKQYRKKNKEEENSEQK